MAKSKTTDAPATATPERIEAAELGRAAVWHEQPDMMRGRALAVLTYLAQVARQVTPDPNGDAYSRDCVRAMGWTILRMVGAIQAAEQAASPLDHVTYELHHDSWNPADSLDRARECLIIVSDHHHFGDDMGFADEEDGLAVLVDMAMLFIADAERAFEKRMKGELP